MLTDRRMRLVVTAALTLASMLVLGVTLTRRNQQTSATPAQQIKIDFNKEVPEKFNANAHDLTQPKTIEIGGSRYYVVSALDAKGCRVYTGHRLFYREFPGGKVLMSNNTLDIVETVCPPPNPGG